MMDYKDEPANVVPEQPANSEASEWNVLMEERMSYGPMIPLLANPGL